MSIGGVHTVSLPTVGRRVQQAQLRQALTALGAAPAPIASLVQRAYWGPQGLTFALRGGLLAYFGDATRPHAKWLSLVRVLADPSSAGASYVNVRLPERPAAGFPPGVTPPGATTHASEPTGASESASASELDADLAAALGAGSRRRRRWSGHHGGRVNRGLLERKRGWIGRLERIHERRLTLESRLRLTFEAHLGARSRVPRSAIILAKLLAVVDTAKFPA